VLELSREDLTSRFEELQRIRNSINECDFSKQKEHLLIRLRKLLPGGSASLNTVCTPDGLSTDPIDIATALRDHWGNVFKQKSTKLNVYRSWLAEDGFSLAVIGIQQDDPRWTTKHSHVREAILEAKESFPGPESIQYKVWKKIEPLATPVGNAEPFLHFT
jgi:hypothetical protein